MTSDRRLKAGHRWSVGVVFILVGCSTQLASAEPPEQPAARPGHRASSLTIFIENDLFLGFDSEYTSGVGFGWTSGDSASYGSAHLVSKMARFCAFLPHVLESEFQTYSSFTIGQEMYTPTDIDLPVPPPDQQPYAGVLFLDSAIYAHGERSMHEYSLRIGCVGPCSGAKQAQRRLHEWLGSPIPQGWEYQLSNEFLLNVGYQFHRLLLADRPAGEFGYDLSAHLGAALGNYMTGANGGFVIRAGIGLTPNFGDASLRTGGIARFIGSAPDPGSGWRVFAYLGVDGFAVARFLPTDGNTFKDSPSVDRESLIGALSGGIVVGYRNVAVTWTLNHIGGFNKIPDSRSNDFGTLTISLYFQR